MGLVNWVKNFFSGKVVENIEQSVLGTKDAYMDEETEQIVKNIETSIEKDFEYYLEQYQNSIQEMDFKKEMFKEQLGEIVKYYSPAVIGGGIFLDIVITDDPKVTAYYFVGFGLIGLLSLTSRYMKFKKSLKNAKTKLKWLKDYINMNRDELIETEGRSVQEIIEHVEGMLVEESDEESLKKLDKGVQVYKKNKTTTYHKKIVDLMNKSKEDDEQIIELRRELKYLKEKIANADKIGQDTSVRLKAIEDQLKLKEYEQDKNYDKEQPNQ